MIHPELLAYSTDLIFLCYPFILSVRIKNEEALLEKELAGYREYEEKIRYRLIPYIC